MCEKFGIELEYTAPYTPQMNGVVERRIAVLLGGARAIMFSANLADEAKKNYGLKLWHIWKWQEIVCLLQKMRKVQINYFMGKILLFYIVWSNFDVWCTLQKEIS